MSPGVVSAVVTRETGSFKSFDGTEIYYEVRGEGEPTIWVYGIACLMNHWHHQIEHFSSKNKVINFDLRGHNRSAIPEDLSLMTVEAMAKDILALMDHLNINKAHFAGHSFGVPVLIAFSALAPQRIASLTFINGFAKNPIQGMFGLDLVEKFFKLGKVAHTSAPDLWKLLWKTGVTNPLSFLITGGIGGFNLQKTEWKDIEIYAKAVSEMSLDMFIPLFEDMMKFDGQDIARRIQAPSLVIAGDRDFVTPLSFQEDLHKSIEGSSYILIRKGSHCTQLDFPEEVNRAMADHFFRHATI